MWRGLLVQAAVKATLAAVPTPSPTAPAPSPTAVPPSPTPLPATPTAAPTATPTSSDLLQGAFKSIVRVVAGRSQGTGFVAARPDGGHAIITNAHVIGEALTS